MPRNEDDLNASSNIQRVTTLEDKIERCYSADRYQDFQTAVEKISLRTLETNDGGDKVKKHAEDYFKGKIVWAIVIWIATIIATALLQKYFKILG
jgi:hypothetical protein